MLAPDPNTLCGGELLVTNDLPIYRYTCKSQSVAGQRHKRETLAPLGRRTKIKDHKLFKKNIPF